MDSSGHPETQIVEETDPGRMYGRAKRSSRDRGRDPAGWFVRRAGLARFTTFACALGLSLSALTGPRIVLAVAGLTVTLAGAVVSMALAGERPRRAVHMPCCVCAVRSYSRVVSCLIVVSVILVGFFAGYLGGNVRVATLMSGDLSSMVGLSVESELVITGVVKSYGGWQSATATVRSLRRVDSVTRETAAGAAAKDMPAVDTAIGEVVLLEVPPDDENRGVGAPTNALRQGMVLVFRGTVEQPDGPSASGYDQARQLLAFLAGLIQLL